MTEEEAQKRLIGMIGGNADPSLGLTEIGEILMDARRADRYGIVPDSDGWTGTWDLNWAAAEAWERKAGMAANQNQMMSDSRGEASSYLYLNCIRMAEMYRSRITASVPSRGKGSRLCGSQIA